MSQMRSCRWPGEKKQEIEDGNRPCWHEMHLDDHSGKQITLPADMPAADGGSVHIDLRDGVLTVAGAIDQAGIDAKRGDGVLRSNYRAPAPEAPVTLPLVDQAPVKA